MKGPVHASEMLDDDLARLERERLVVLHLDDLEGLLSESGSDVFEPRRGPCRAGRDPHTCRRRRPRLRLLAVYGNRENKNRENKNYDRKKKQCARG